MDMAMLRGEMRKSHESLHIRSATNGILAVFEWWTESFTCLDVL